jgi:hypothetical protein
MSTYTIAGIALGPGGPVNGAIVNAYKAQRFSSAPAYNAAAPGTADAGPVTSGTSAAGGPGLYLLACPTNESYYVSTTWNGNTSWTLVNDLNFQDTVETTVAAGSNGLTLAQVVTATLLDVAATSAFSAGPGRIYVTTSGGQAVLSYTTVTGGGTPSFNGIAVVSGTTSWTVSTGAAVVSPQVVSLLNQTLDDGLGDMTIAGNATVDGVTAVIGGAVTTPTFVSTTPQQLSATQNGVLYIDVTTAASLTIAIGPTSSATTVLQTSIVSALGLTHVHVPAGWYVKLTGTMADLAFKFITGI